VFSVCCVFTSHPLVTASIRGNCSTKSSLHRLLYNWLTSKLVSVIISWHKPCRKHHFQQFLYCCVWTPCGNLFVLWSLPTNGSTRYIITPIRAHVSCWGLHFHSSHAGKTLKWRTNLGKIIHYLYMALPGATRNECKMQKTLKLNNLNQRLYCMNINLEVPQHLYAVLLQFLFSKILFWAMSLTIQSYSK
jgi:hypothetical protein